MTRDQLCERLSTLGARRSAARAEALAISADIASTAKKARAAGIPKTEIATLAQISRPALDDMLAR
jgi:hypothetical protein